MRRGNLADSGMADPTLTSGYIFVVRYLASERSEFHTFHVRAPADWEQLLQAKLPEHTCGYLIRSNGVGWHLDGVPRHQRQKFCDQTLGAADEPARREAQLDRFLLALQRNAVDLSDSWLKQQAKLAKREPQTPQAQARETTGEKHVSSTETVTKKSVGRKPKAEKIKKTGGSRVKLFQEDDVITVVAKENPRRQGSKTYDIFKLYKTGMKVKDFVAKGGRVVDVKADLDRGHISVKSAK